ncbi:MAG: acyltransferase family protein [Ruminococcus sp.]|nr:acyltransferase family protein [Ruminococcus sp.]
MVVFSIVFYLLLFVLIFYKSKVYFKNPNVNYLSKENANSVKAICALGVVLHHITNEVVCGALFSPFQIIGFMMVAIFFFYSGYGLIFSLKNNPDYIKTFLSKRMVNIMIPYFLALVLYYIFYLICGQGLNFAGLFTQFLGKDPIIRYSWFIIVLIYLYITFWVSFKVFKNKTISYFIFYTLVSFWSIGFFLPHWSPSIVAFLLGALFANFKSFFDKLLLKKGWIVIITSLVIFLSLVVLRMNCFGSVKTIISFLVSIVFCVLIISSLTRINIHNRFLSFFGKISFEIYLYHGLMILIFNKLEFVKNNAMLYILLTLLFTVIVSYLMYKLKGLIIRNKADKNTR